MQNTGYSKGKAFEYFMKKMLLQIGFHEVLPDGTYLFDGSAGLMINGLGEAHNADVLLEPPVQTPFYALTRILIECKSYTGKVGINTVRSALGLREDINSFDVVDKTELENRQRNRRSGVIKDYNRYYYQVAVASLNGYTAQAQNFAATHRIPIIQLDNMPYWEKFMHILSNPHSQTIPMDKQTIEASIDRLLSEMINKTAIAITNSGQLLLLYKTDKSEETDPSTDLYYITWESEQKPWKMILGNTEYHFQLPDIILKNWINNSKNEFELRKNAIECKYNDFSSMVMYYSVCGTPKIKMISIDKDALVNAAERLHG